MTIQNNKILLFLLILSGIILANDTVHHEWPGVVLANGHLNARLLDKAHFETIGEEVLAQQSIVQALKNSGTNLEAVSLHYDLTDKSYMSVDSKNVIKYSYASKLLCCKTLGLSEQEHDRNIRIGIKHEVGHIVNGDVKFLRNFLDKAILWGMPLAAFCVASKKAIKGIIAKDPKNYLFAHAIAVGAMSASYTWRNIRSQYFLSIERKADDFSIKHTTDPLDLEATGSFFAKRDEQLFGFRFFPTHPPDKERAHTFFAAAHKLKTAYASLFQKNWSQEKMKAAFVAGARDLGKS